jgi:DNA primase
MHLDPHQDNERAKCFSCGFSVDIFKAAHALEKKPAAGPGWVYDNVYYLAKKFGLHFEETKPTEEELLYMQLASIYDDAAEILKHFATKDPECTKYAMSRGLTVETCAAYGVASIPWQKMAEALKTNGHDLALCEKYGIDSDMFNQDRVTFELRDINGMTIGFARKYIPYDKEAHKAAKASSRYYPVKYKNTSSQVPFFDKGSFVYGLDTAKTETHKRLDIFEGYFDVLVGKQFGLMATAGTCGTSLTEYQVKAMMDCGFHHVNLVFDSEPEGMKAAKKNLEMFAGHEGLHLTIMFLPFEESVPKDQRDPDVFLKTNGVGEYLKVVPMSAFDWKLEDLLGAKVDKEEIPELLIPYILNETSKVRQGTMVKLLCLKTGVDEVDVRAEIARRTDKRVQGIADSLARQLSIAKDAKQKLDIIQRANTELSSATQDTSVDLTFDESVEAFIKTCDKNESNIVGISGWDTGWPRFNEDFDGLPKEGQIIGIPGASNCGKSAWVTTLATNLLIHNKTGLTVIYHILDDPRPIAFSKLLSCVTGLPIKYITHVAKYVDSNPAIKDSYYEAKAWLLQCMKNGRLIVKGQELGNGTDITSRLIDKTYDQTKNHLIYIGDSLHSLDDQASSEERIKFKRVAEWTMRMTETHPMSMVFTVELRKQGMDGRPRISDLAESGKLIYAMKAIGMFYNELHDKRNLCQNFWVEETKDPVTGQVIATTNRPIIEADWAKNKITEFKGTHYLRFYDNVARIEELSTEDLLRERENAKKAIARRQPNELAIGNMAVQHSKSPKGMFMPPSPIGVGT